MGQALTPAQALRAIDWLANGDTCPASQTLVFWLAFGVRKEGVYHPRDVPSLRRCVVAIDRIGLSDRVSGLASLSPEWRGLAAMWTALAQQLRDEAGEFWDQQDCAPKTHRMLRAACVPPGGADAA